ncbi:MAG: sulfur-oxidizing protein SoxY [Phenylobacterium sp.]|jgi:sulfur-oxidizing protein SoxY
MNLSRRGFLQKISAGAAYMVVLAAMPGVAWAQWSKKAFAANGLQEAISSKYGNLAVIDSDAVTLKAPAIAENGKVVPISVRSSLDNVASISVFVEQNPMPLATSITLGKGSIADISVRIRMAKTSSVIALVEADGKLYRTSREVKVTIGGCGG